MKTQQNGAEQSIEQWISGGIFFTEKKEQKNA